ncbi:hypothetical protein CKO36_13140 [Rhabdochromatium marinum]|nr:hypothetical protein [Rhabdochromatium marinum]
MLKPLGFAEAQPSKREQLLPAQITETICKAHRVPLHAHASGEQPLSPLKVGAVWYGLALDLVLGNIDQPAWYWSDPRAIFLLDYWRGIDPELRFILIYDDPGQALLRVPSESGASTANMLDHWCRYNQALLAFYRRHRSVCTLVHAQGVLQQSAERVRQWLDVPMIAPASSGPAPAERSASTTSDALAELLTQIGIAPDDKRVGEMTGRVVASYLLPQLLATHQASALLYEELQATANVSGALKQADKPTAEAAWRNFIQTREHLANFISRLFSEKNALLAERQQEQATHEKALAELQAKPAPVDESKLKDLEEENELLLLQLHQVQEELERYFLENQALKEGRPARLKPVAPKVDHSGGPHYGAAERVKQQLTYRLGAIMVSYSKKPKKWLHIPGALMKEAKQFDREKPEREARKLPPIDTYADAYEAERVKRHLSYRLGTVLMENRKSPLGWITMPWKMHRAVREFRAERN